MAKKNVTNKQHNKVTVSRRDWIKEPKATE